MVEAQQKPPEVKDSDNNGVDPGPSTSGKQPKPKKEKKDGTKQRTKKTKKDSVKPLTKVVIRRLPPSMDEETFRKQIDPIPDHDDFCFVSGDWSLGKNASSRAYINFTRAEDIFLFKDKFDGYDFVDAKGVEYPAVVEFAPFQELPRNRSRKKDAKCGTIEADTHFVAFREALEAEEREGSGGKSGKTIEFSYRIKDEKKVTSTPLLEFLAQKKQEKRDEKRKKMEEKKKQKKEERQKKVPEVIKEEKGREDDIVVRTVPSRLDPNQGRKEQGGKKGGERVDNKGEGGKEKEKRQRNRKDKDKDKEKEKDKERVKPVKQEETGGEQKKELSRKQERDRLRKEKEKLRKQEEREKRAQTEGAKPKEKEITPKPEVPVQKPVAASEAPKKEVKKYSERRKETRARAETRLAELEERKDNSTGSTSLTSDHFTSIPVIPKIDIKKSILTPHVAPFIPKEKSTIILGESGSISLPPAFPQKSATPTSPSPPPPPPAPPSQQPEAPETPPPDSSSSEKKLEIDEKLKEAREARKIRNKARPSIEIYQPRKRLTTGGGSKEGEDDKPKEKSDSDRSSEQSVKPGSSNPATGTGGKAKDKRHKLTKKASDKERPRDRRGRRKSSFDSGGGASRKNSRKNSKEDVPPAEPVPRAATPAEKSVCNISEVVEALEGVKLDS